MPRTLPPFAFGLALGPLLLLAGCDQFSAPKAGPTASGEVLPGTVSDAMLNIDRTQAEAPLAPAARSVAVKDVGASGAAVLEPTPDASGAAVDISAAEAPAAPTKPKSSASPKPAAP